MTKHHFFPGDARGWIGAGVYVLVLIILLMIYVDRSLLKDDYFKTIATAIILTGFINGPVGWAYQATKAGGEMAESSARIAEQAAGVTPTADAPKDVQEASQATADAAQKKADDIAGQPQGTTL